MSYRRSGLLVSKNNLISPISTACQVCNQFDSLYSCIICSKITCVRCKIICNKNTYCKDCYFNNEVNSLIIIDINKENKQTCLKKIKSAFIYSISFDWKK